MEDTATEVEVDERKETTGMDAATATRGTEEDTESETARETKTAIAMQIVRREKIANLRRGTQISLRSPPQLHREQASR